LILDLVKNKKSRIAVIGASKDESKYGYKILKNLISKGYEVTPINPKKIIIDGIESLPSVDEMSPPPDIIDFVVPPEIAFSEVKKLHKGGYDNFWFQPGSESAELVEYLKDTNVSYLIDECIMTQTSL
tara:strand:- start:5597 stop:5980 length:384 start_codon:yes stop_codon:yes gene_type:complete